MMTQSPPTVLVVDDEPRSLETLRRTLEEEYEVLTAPSAHEAEEILEREWVQVVICDQRMPGETGVDFLSRVRDRWPETVRIIISGYTDAGDLVEAINKAGIYQYISKPWHPDKLLLKLRNAVELFQLQRQNALLATEMKLRPETVAEEALRHRQPNMEAKAPEDHAELVVGVAFGRYPAQVDETPTGRKLFLERLEFSGDRFEGEV